MKISTILVVSGVAAVFTGAVLTQALLVAGLFMIGFGMLMASDDH